MTIFEALTRVSESLGRVIIFLIITIDFSKSITRASSVTVLNPQEWILVNLCLCILSCMYNGMERVQQIIWLDFTSGVVILFILKFVYVIYR